MGLPSINIAFSTAAAETARKASSGDAAVIVRDTVALGGHVLTGKSKLPEGLGADNQAYIKRAFLGNTEAPRRVIVYVLPQEEGKLADALAWLATQEFDYLAGPPDVTEEEAMEIAAWVDEQRDEYDARCKAVLPNVDADSEAVINFTTETVKVGDVTYTAAQYCSRIAGLLAGTPAKISCTFAALEEVTDVSRLSRSAADAAIDAGEFILIHDGEKVKVGRGVNSLTTVTDTKGEVFKKIKVVAVVDLIESYIRRTAEDVFIGKYPCTYDNKLVLVTAIRSYFESLSRDSIIGPVFSVDIDTEAQAAWLEAHGTDTSAMSEKEIREANTRDAVFLKAAIQINDVIENIGLNIAM